MILTNILESFGQAASIIISIAVMLFVGFALTRLTKLAHLPNVTAYICTGILLGPILKMISGYSIVPDSVVSGMDFLSDIALAFIAFSTGEFFKFDALKKNGPKVIIITIFESLMATVVVFILTYVILKLELSFAIVLSALAAATAPASTMMTIKQTNAKGDFVNTLLQVVALDDIVGLICYSIAISVALASLSGAGVTFGSVIKPLLINLGVLVLGCIFGVLLKLLMPQRRTNDNRLIIGIATLFAFCGICALLDVSPLLGCMSMGTVYMNITNDDKLFKQLNYFSPPILLLFFVRSGLNFDLASLTQSGAIGRTPLLLIGILYFVIRIIGKYLGAFLGSLTVKKSKEVRNYLGLALIPQAGVAIGLAALGARTFTENGASELGKALETIILASSVLYELIGPACAKLSLYLSKSYSNDIDELAPIEEPEKSEVEKLIEQIKKIQETLPEHDMSEEERAFIEGSNEMTNYQYLYNRKYKNWRK